MRKPILLLAALTALQAAAPVGAAIAYTATLSTPLPLSESGTGSYYYSGFRQHSFAADNGLLTGDFGADKQFQVTFAAPTGMRYEVSAPPLSAFQYGFFAQFWSTGGVSGPTSSASGVAVSFAGATGALPTLDASQSEFESGVGTGFRATALFSVASAFAFESVTMTFNVPAGFNEVFNNFEPGILQLEAYLAPIPILEQPMLMTLAPTPTSVPEPSTLALLGLGLAGFAAFRRRLSAS